jgi:hypothetical protein
VSELVSEPVSELLSVGMLSVLLSREVIPESMPLVGFPVPESIPPCIGMGMGGLEPVPVLVGDVGVEDGDPESVFVPLSIAPVVLGGAVVPHLPALHTSEQQSPKFLQLAPSCAHAAAVPPHLPLLQSALQQSFEAMHEAPSAAQVGATDAEEDDVTQTPAHDVLQQSLHDEHASPAATHAFEPVPYG